MSNYRFKSHRGIWIVLFWLFSLLSFAFFRVTPTGGLDYEHAFITRISTAMILAAVIVVHLVFAKQLLAHYREHKKAD